jgi:alanine racemase
MSDFPATARAWVDIDLGALVANARTLAGACGAPLMPMVKANGYGLGAAPVARALLAVEPWGFGVATPEEGGELRAAGIDLPILVTSPHHPSATEACLRSELRPAIGDLEALRDWCGRSDRPFHLELDTGMARAGVRWSDRDTLAEASTILGTAPGWEGAFTHFHSAEDDEPSVAVQWSRLQEVLRCLPRRPPLVHAANSAAALKGTAYAADLVRPGIFLYGGQVGATVPRAVAALRAPVVAVRSVEAGDTVSYGATWHAVSSVTVATLGVGYADGLPRAARVAGTPSRTVELGGRACPLVGRVTMDMTMVAADADARIGDVATVYGGLVSLDQQARASGTISYELLTALGPRVPRRYHA